MADLASKKGRRDAMTESDSVPDRPPLRSGDPAPDLAALDCALLAVSVDSLYSDLAWRAPRTWNCRAVSWDALPASNDEPGIFGRCCGMHDEPSGGHATRLASRLEGT
jgi:hypothetical protein